MRRPDKPHVQRPRPALHSLSHKYLRAADRPKFTDRARAFLSPPTLPTPLPPLPGPASTPRYLLPANQPSPKPRLTTPKPHASPASAPRYPTRTSRLPPSASTSATSNLSQRLCTAAPQQHLSTAHPRSHSPFRLCSSGSRSTIPSRPPASLRKAYRQSCSCCESDNCFGLICPSLPHARLAQQTRATPGLH